MLSHSRRPSLNDEWVNFKSTHFVQICSENCWIKRLPLVLLDRWREEGKEASYDITFFESFLNEGKSY